MQGDWDIGIHDIYGCDKLIKEYCNNIVNKFESTEYQDCIIYLQTLIEYLQKHYRSVLNRQIKETLLGILLFILMNLRTSNTPYKQDFLKIIMNAKQIFNLTMLPQIEN